MCFPKFKANAEENIRKMCNTANFDENAIDLLTQMVQLEPSRRISAKAALQHPYFNDYWADAHDARAQAAS